MCTLFLIGTLYISEECEIRPDRTFYLRGIYPFHIGENARSIASLILIWASWNWQVSRTDIKSLTSSTLHQIIILFGVTCPLRQKMFPKNYNERTCCPIHIFFRFDWNFVKLADNQNRHIISEKLEILPDWIIHLRVICTSHIGEIVVWIMSLIILPALKKWGGGYTGLHLSILLIFSSSVTLLISISQ